jgi:hypothetical protein
MGILHIETLSRVSTDGKVVDTALLVNAHRAQSGIFTTAAACCYALPLALGIASQIVRDFEYAIQSLSLYVKRHFLGLWHSGSRPVEAVRETTFPARRHVALSLRGAASQRHRREARARKRDDLSIAPYVKLHFTEDPLVVDRIVCRNSAGVGCGMRVPGITAAAAMHGLHRIARWVSRVVGER